jgi:glycerophosphoryl diester phosphodiesterase
VPTRRFVAAARRLGYPVDVWTVNDSATARRLWARGVAGIVTNVPDQISVVRPTSS